MTIERWIVATCGVLSLCTGSALARAHESSGSVASGTSYRIGAGAVYERRWLRLGNDGTISSQLGGAAADVFIGKALSPSATTGLDLHLTASLPFKAVALGEDSLEDVALLGVGLLWQTDVDLCPSLAYRLGIGAAFERLIEGSGLLEEHNAFGVIGLAGLPITLRRYGASSHNRTRLVPSVTLSHALSGAEATGFHGSTTLGVTLTLEIAYDPQ